MERVQNYIRAWRKHRRLTLEDVAQRLGTTKISVSRWERGVHPITVDQLKRVADVLGCSLTDLLTGGPCEAAAA